MQFEYITTNAEILSGKPIIRDTRISVDFILQLVASGAGVDDIVKKYPHLKKEAVAEALIYAGEVVKNEIVIDLRPVA